MCTAEDTSFVVVRPIKFCDFVLCRRNLFSQVHYFIHLNLAIALFLAYLVFVLGIQLARKSEVRRYVDTWR